MMHMPDPFLEKLMEMDGPSQGMSDGLIYGGRAQGRGNKYMPKKVKKEAKKTNNDRRLPMIHRIQGGNSRYYTIPFTEMEPKKPEFIGWDHMQYLGENMASC